MTELAHISHTQAFMLGEWQVDPDSYHIKRGDSEVKLAPKVMQVLLCLAEQPGKVVSREALERTVWAGSVVGYDAIAGTVIKLRKALGDDSRHPRYIETVSKKGYRLLTPIDSNRTLNEHESRTHDGAQSIGSRSISYQHLKSYSYALTAVMVLLAIAGVWYFFNTGLDKQGWKNISPSIVVLPFKNLSKNPSQEYLSEAMTDDLITDLSKIKSLRVIARQSAYHYKEREQFTLTDLANELGVQYVVQGSVLNINNRIRINIQISHATKDQTIWAKRYDIDQKNIFTLQNDITQQVITALYLTPSQQESVNISSQGTNIFAAYNEFLLGQKYFKNRSKQGFERAMHAYQRAIEIDPNYARAYGAMAVGLTRGNRGRWIDLSYQEASLRSLELVKKAVSLNQSSPQVYWSLGFVHLYRKEFSEAESAVQQAVTLSPNYADGYGLLAFISNWRGKWRQAEKFIRKAIDLNPYHTFEYPWNLGLSFYYQARYQEAVEQLQAALERNKTALYPRLFLAASYVQLDELDNAEWEVEQITATRNEASLSQLDIQLPFENKQHLDELKYILRKAGLPE